MVANEKARFDEVKSYHSDDVILTLPNAMTIFDVGYLAIYNPDISDNAAHVTFNLTGKRWGYSDEGVGLRRSAV